VPARTPILTERSALKMAPLAKRRILSDNSGCDGSGAKQKKIFD
jgi:hypothetical protein